MWAPAAWQIDGIQAMWFQTDILKEWVWAKRRATWSLWAPWRRAGEEGLQQRGWEGAREEERDCSRRRQWLAVADPAEKEPLDLKRRRSSLILAREVSEKQWRVNVWLEWVPGSMWWELGAATRDNLSRSFTLFLKNKFIYLILAALGLCCCARAFSSCREWGPLFVAVRGLLTVVASRSTGSRHVGFSSCSTRAQ